MDLIERTLKLSILAAGRCQSTFGADWSAVWVGDWRLLVSNDDLTPKVESLVANYSQMNNFQRTTPHLSVMRKIKRSVTASNFKPCRKSIARFFFFFISSPFRGTDYADRWFYSQFAPYHLTTGRILSTPCMVI